MGAPYQSTSVTGYNSNPPPDDGSQTEANRVRWATIKAKLTDPFSAFAAAINNAINAAFGKIIGGAGIVDTAVSYAVLSADQGKLIRATASGITITTPDAADVGSPFVFRFLNDSDGDVQFSAFSGQTVDGVASIAVPSKCGFSVDTNGTNWFTDGQNFQRTQVFPQGYLTLVSEATDALSPVIRSDQSARTAVYYRPDVGDLIPVPDGTNFAVKSFSEMSLTLNSNHVANAIYDVFVFDDGGTLRLVTGTAWNTATAGSGARGTGAGTTELTRLKGLLVNKNQMTVRNGATTYTMAAMHGLYVGSLYIDGSAGQVTCHVSFGQSRKWGVWNAYNKKKICLKGGDSTGSWTYGTATLRPSNGSTANSVSAFAGLPEAVRAEFKQHHSNNGSAQPMTIAVGVNSTTTASGLAARRLGLGATYTDFGTMVGPATYDDFLSIGVTTFTSLEQSSSGGSPTFFGTASYMLLSAEWVG